MQRETQSSQLSQLKSDTQKLKSHCDTDVKETLKESDHVILEYITVKKGKAGHNQMLKNTFKKVYFLKTCQCECFRKIYVLSKVQTHDGTQLKKK